MPAAFTSQCATATAAPATGFKADLAGRAAQLSVGLTPVHSNFGLQVSGLDLREPLTDAQQALLLDAWRWHDLLLFRGQELSPADEQRLLQYLPHDAQAIAEERFCNAFFKPRIPSNPLLCVRGGGIDVEEHHGVPREQLQQLKFQGGQYATSRLWHMDLSHSQTPPEVSSMYMVIAPDHGGETLFASTVTAFERLSAEDQQLLVDLDTVNAPGSELTDAFRMAAGGTRRLDDIQAGIEHMKGAGWYIEVDPVPLVIQDPNTGRRSFVASVQRVKRFRRRDGSMLSRQETLDLLERILKAATADSEMWALKWQPNDFAVWANRRIIHSTTPEEDYNTASRMFHLVFLDSNTPVVAARDC